MNALSKNSARTSRVICFLLALMMLLSILPTLSTRAAKVLTETVDLSTIRQAARGEGYYWSNRNKTMTFTNLNMDTEDDYGFRFPSNATLILNGNNVIKAKSVAIAGQDTLKVKGNGTLTLIAETGIKMVSPELTSTLTFMDGKVTINAKTCGVYSEYPTVIVGNTDLTINLEDPTGTAIDAYSVMLNNGKFTSNAPVRSQNHLSCGGCEVKINASSPALVAREIKIGDGNKISVGSGESLSPADSYSGENSIALKPTRSQKKSLILGDNYAVYWDYIILALAVVLLSASIALPIIYKQRKDKKKRAEVEARRAAQAEAKKQAAKEARRAKYAGSKKSHHEADE